MPSPAIDSILADPLLLDEIRSRTATEAGMPRLSEFNLSATTLRAIVEPEAPTAESFDSRPVTEAIVLEFGRPSLLVQNGTFAVPESDVWKDRLALTKSTIEQVIRSVGRIELLDHPTYSWVGTGWVIAENIIVTNRHVASLFAEKRGKSFAFSQNPFGKPIRANIDFKEEHKQPTIFEASLDKVIYIANPGGLNPDMALLRLKKTRNLPAPILLSTTPRPQGTFVGVIGYPARDGRVEEQIPAMIRIFGDVYNVKRFAPGQIISFNESDLYLTHDCSTLGGNSGSVVMDLETGEAVGLHFSGTFQKANYAVKAEVVLKTLTSLKVQVPVAKPSPVVERGGLEEAVAEARPEDYGNRQGYRADFLGAATQHKVPLPTMTAAQRADVTEMFPQAPGTPRYVLNYTHFSLVMSRSRRIARLTAVNIDGNDLRRVVRRDDWAFDPRIPKEAQIGDKFYVGNDLDRGHLVRREDPVWGPPEVARLGNNDTFHFTNASPQFGDFNKKTWRSLEDYILDNARVHDLKVSVFTGPVFKDDDREYRGVKIPRQYWKVVVLVNADTRRLSATAYILSQADLITNLEFVFGEFKTYQVSVRYIERLTGLKFGKLRDFDPKGKQEGFEVQLLNRLENIEL